MILSLLTSLVMFAGCAFGLAWLFVARWDLAPVEKFVTSVALSLIGIFIGAWLLFIFKLPQGILWLVPALAFAGLLLQHRALVELVRDPDVRALATGLAIVSAWNGAWLTLVVTYSGGGWAADWFEHWERARFFVTPGSPDTVFIGHAALTARPPLANVLVATFLTLTRVDFAHYQVFSTLLAGLAFLPAALFARDIGGTRAIRVLVLLLMCNPLFVQNSVFAWTKLPTAFFVLSGLHFFLRAWRDPRPVGHASLSAILLAAGLLAHYSAGPYVVLLAAGWLVATWIRRREPQWWRATWAAASAGTALLAVWFGWALHTYGAKGSLLANTSVTEAAPELTAQLIRIALNLRDTLVPHVLRSPDMTFMAQTNAWAALRDGWFQLYQLNLLFAFGSVGGIVLLVLLVRVGRTAEARARSGWAAFVVGTVVLGVAVHGARDTWGLTHICLQSLVLLGLAFLSGHWSLLTTGWRRLLIAGAIIDAVFGIVLHFAVQNLAFERWRGPAAFASWQAENSAAAVMNFSAKLQHRLAFVGDLIAAPPAIVAGGLAALAVLTVVWTRRGKMAVDTGP